MKTQLNVKIIGFEKDEESHILKNICNHCVDIPVVSEGGRADVIIVSSKVPPGKIILEKSEMVSGILVIEEGDVAVLPYFVSQGFLYTFRTSDLYTNLASLIQVVCETSGRVNLYPRQQIEHFLSWVRHEIGNPLSSIIGISETALRQLPPGDGHNYVSLMYKSASRLYRLTNRLLKNIVVPGSEREIQFEQVKLRKLLDEILTPLRYQAGLKGLSFKTHVDEDVPVYLKLDTNALTQIFNNIVGNAIKYTKKGSINVSVRKKGSHLFLSVQDTGIGIPSELQIRVFDPFYQIDQKGLSNGFGLGLSIIRDIIRSMDGDVGIESEAGEGTTVYCTFKVQNADHVVDEPEAKGQPPKGISVLLAEDDPVNQVYLVHMLEHEGYMVHLVSSGEDVMFELRHHSYDVLLMDIHLEGMDGDEVMRRLSDNSGQYKKTRIIALTASVNEKEYTALKELGFYGVLSKPLEMEQLRNLLDNLPVHSHPTEYDISRLISEYSSDEEIGMEIIRVFLEDTPQKITRLEKALQEKDFKQLARSAHSLANTAAILRVEDLSILCRDLQSAAKDEKKSVVDKLSRKVIAQVNELIDCIREWVDYSGRLSGIPSIAASDAAKDSEQ